MSRWASDIIDLPSDSNISKIVGLNIAFRRKFSKEHSTAFLMVWKLIEFALVVLKLSMFKDCGIIGISKIELFIFFGTERVKLIL